MRLRIKTKQVAGVTLIVGLAMAVLSAWYLSSLVDVRLEESRARAEARREDDLPSRVRRAGDDPAGDRPGHGAPERRRPAIDPRSPTPTPRTWSTPPSWTRSGTIDGAQRDHVAWADRLEPRQDLDRARRPRHHRRQAADDLHDATELEVQRAAAARHRTSARFASAVVVAACCRPRSTSACGTCC